MGLVSNSIANLINGVSQQPAALRLPSQCEAQENCYSSVVEGLKRRDPTQHLAKIQTGTLADAYIHTINRDSVERYIVIITDGDLKVYDLAGTEKTVAFPSGKGYLTATTPSEAFRAITVADYTFVVNSTTEVAMDAALSVGNGSEGIAFVKQAFYNSDYNIYIDGVLKATYTTPGTGAIKTNTIASSLATSLTTNLGAGWGVSAVGSTIHVVKVDGTDFSIVSTDSQGDVSLKAFRGKVQRFTDLPTVAPTGFRVEVIGDNTSNFDNYYVKFEPFNVGGNFEEGVWVETVATGIQYQLDADTMPHTLVRESDGTFTFAPATWGDRVAGDEDSAPNPSLVGRTINDVFFLKNRLGFLAGENTVTSRHGDFFDFFPLTVTTLLDSGPIDVAASHNKVSILYHAVPYAKELLLFSSGTQFEFTGGDLLTPKTAAIDLTTEFDSSTLAKPINAGKNVFYATAKGMFSGLREYFVDAETSVNDAADVTSHVPHYLQGNIFKLAAASNEDLLLAFSSVRTECYPYKYFWSGDEKLQSSWSKWTFNGATVLNGDFIGNELYLVMQYPDGVYLNKIEVTPGTVDPGTTYLSHLDRRISDAQATLVSYDPGTDKTTWTLPYTPNPASTHRVVTRFAAASGVNPGVVLQGIVVSGDTIKVNGDHSTTPVWIGETYKSRYVFGTQYIKEKSAGGGTAAVGAGRLQLLTWSLVVSNSGYFEAHVTHSHRPAPSIYKFTGFTLGSSSNVLGNPSLETRTFAFPVLAKNNEVTVAVESESHLPFHLISAEWSADYNIKAQRLARP